MHVSPAHGAATGAADRSDVLEDPPWLRRTLIGATCVALVGFLVLPLATVFVEALRRGLGPFTAALAEPDALSAVRLTLVCAAIAVPLNAAFGLAAAWALGKFRFRGRNLIVSLIDLPFAVSPVVAGLLFVLLFGMHGWFGPWLAERGIRVLFAVPGIVLATTFVTLPFVARELLAQMEEQGDEAELAAATLGAGGWSTFLRVTLPSVKWSLLYGVLLCNARAMGEFGAVSVVSGHIRGETNTLPLHVEVLYQEYEFVGAFAAASVLSALAIVTLAVRSLLEWRAGRRARAGETAVES